MEYRNFLLFIPAHTPNLRAVLSYYSSTVKVNPEGDVHISDDTIHSTGTPLQFLMQSLFGAIITIAKPPTRTMPYDSGPVAIEWETQAPLPMAQFSSETDSPEIHPPTLPDTGWAKWEHVKAVLIECVPKPGYFLAGGLAGIVSRTSTAPLDRLRVYLIAQTGVARDAIQAAKPGAALRAATHAWKPLVDATRELWRAGGIRSLYAGMLRLEEDEKVY